MQNYPHSVDVDNKPRGFIYVVHGQVLNGWCDLHWNQSPVLDALLRTLNLSLRCSILISHPRSPLISLQGLLANPKGFCVLFLNHPLFTFSASDSTSSCLFRAPAQTWCTHSSLPSLFPVPVINQLFLLDFHSFVILGLCSHLSSLSLSPKAYQGEAAEERLCEHHWKCCFLFVLFKFTPCQYHPGDDSLL